MIVGEGRATVAAPPNEVFEFVLDLERYREADHKIGRVGPVVRTANGGSAKFWGRIRGLPGPAGVYPFTLTPTRLRFGSPTAGPARWFLGQECTLRTEKAVGDLGYAPVVSQDAGLEAVRAALGAPAMTS